MLWKFLSESTKLILIEEKIHVDMRQGHSLMHEVHHDHEFVEAQELRGGRRKTRVTMHEVHSLMHQAHRDQQYFIKAKESIN